MSSYTQLSEVELDGVTSTLVSIFPNNGVVIMWGHLKSLNIFVPRAKVHESLLRVSSHLVEARQRNTVHSRFYHAPALNCLWHINGLHCLIRWNIVVHGGRGGGGGGGGDRWIFLKNC